jgi:hypothetical protein
VRIAVCQQLVCSAPFHLKFYCTRSMCSISAAAQIACSSQRGKAILKDLPSILKSWNVEDFRYIHTTDQYWFISKNIRRQKALRHLVQLLNFRSPRGPLTGSYWVDPKVRSPKVRLEVFRNQPIQQYGRKKISSWLKAFIVRKLKMWRTLCKKYSVFSLRRWQVTGRQTYPSKTADIRSFLQTIAAKNCWKF